jgi:hypothetical protein
MMTKYAKQLVQSREALTDALSERDGHVAETIALDGDASVRFIFDTHAVIYCDDAPALERTRNLSPCVSTFKTAEKSSSEPR